MRGERGVRRSMYSSAFAAGFMGEEEAERVASSNPRPISEALGAEVGLRWEGGGVIGAAAVVVLCMRLRRPLRGSSLNGSHKEVCAGVERMPLELRDSVSLLNRLIEEGDGLEARKRR